MRRLRIVLVAAFLAGVLLAGVGAGLTMVEWSSLEYGGTKLLDSEYLVTEDFDFALKDDGSIIILGESYYTNRYLDGIEEDPSVPEGIVRYQVTYNQAQVEPFLQYMPYDRTVEAADESGQEPPEMSGGEAADESGQEPPAVSVEETEDESGEEPSEDSAPVVDGVLRLMRSYYGDEFRLFMENKDEMLSDLKNGKLSSYEIADITGVKILVNPVTRPRVKDETRY